MNNKIRKIIQEAITLDINVGDEILAGRFKNKKVIVKDIGKDEKNQPTINGKSILKFRIKKLIKEEIKKIFEGLEFETAAAEQISTNMALFKLPRKGLDDSINNYNQIQSQKSRYETPDEKEDSVEDDFKSPELNAPNAATLTNIYESKEKDKEIEESYGIYGDTAAQQQNLDFDRGTSVNTANFSTDAQDEFDLHNNNISRELNTVPPGNSREGGVSNNKFKNF